MTIHHDDAQPTANGRDGRVQAFFRKLSSERGKVRSERSDQAADGEAGTVSSSTISSDFTITGNISCKGKAQFDGELNGNIECQNLIVGKNGRIIGDIKAENVVVFGKVDGAIHCMQVTLKSGANVSGDILHQGIAIEMGASFLGRSDRLDDEAGKVSVASMDGNEQARHTPARPAQVVK